jgi:hypothetical protein
VLNVTGTMEQSWGTAIYTLQWSGTLSADHKEAEPGGVIVESLSAVNSPLLEPR